MSEIHRQHNEIDRSVLDLLEIFHADTPKKLDLAPVDSRPLVHSDTGISPLDENGWPEDYDDLDQDDAIHIVPTSVTDIEMP